MLTDAEMRVAAARLIGLKLARAVEGKTRLGRGRQIAGAADQPRHMLGDGVEHFAGRVPRGDALVVGGECRQERIPLLRQGAGQKLLDLARGLRKFPPVGGKQLFPIVAQRAAAPADVVAELVIDAIRHQKLRVFRPAVKTLGETYLLLTERIAVRRRGVLLVRRAVADDAVDDDQRRPVLDAAEYL